ncbi:MAG: hypothetical protein JSW05_02260 [Candidatus Thorarchaeota archaeon]|nr:MAG: hypothetical protein JSW05_02260 [Candidatus Thorarchaeota archaeon]
MHSLVVQQVQELVAVRIGRQYSKALLLMGLALVLLSGYAPTMATDYYVWNFIAGGIGIFLIIVASGDFFVNEQMDSKATSLNFLGFVLVGIGSVLLMYIQLALNVQLAEWWGFPLAGVAFLLCGVTLILWTRHQTSS